jgi:hypothetical protein
MSKPFTKCDLANRINNATHCAEKVAGKLAEVHRAAEQLVAYLDETRRMLGSDLPIESVLLRRTLSILLESEPTVVEIRDAAKFARVAVAEDLRTVRAA